MKEVPLSIEDPEAKVLIGSSIPEKIDQDLLNFLRTRSKTFAWKHEDITGIDKSIITHKRNIDPSFRPIHQMRRKFAPERNQNHLTRSGKAPQDRDDQGSEVPKMAS